VNVKIRHGIFGKGVGAAVTLGVFFAGSAAATIITGSVDITGTAGVSATAIDFYQGIPGCSTGPNLGTGGCFLTGDGTGSFTTDVGTNGTMKDLTGPPVGPQFLANFMSFSNGVTFDLTSVPFAGSPACGSVDATQGGTTCVPGTGPGPGTSGFRLTNGPGPGPNGTGTATSVGILFTVLVNGYTGTSAQSTPYIGIFTTQVAGQNAQDVLNALAANGGTGFFVHSYSATFSPLATVPEPGTLTLFCGAGLLGLGAILRKARRA
jgi:hypothetical protein